MPSRSDSPARTKRPLDVSARAELAWWATRRTLLRESLVILSGGGAAAGVEGSRAAPAGTAATCERRSDRDSLEKGSTCAVLFSRRSIMSQKTFIPSGEKPSKGFLFAARVAHGHLHLYSEAHRGTERRSGRKTHFPESRLKRRKFAIPHESPLLATNSRIRSANS